MNWGNLRWKKFFFLVSRSTCSVFYKGKTEWNIYEDGEKYTQAVYQHLLQEFLCQPWWSVGCFGGKDVCSTVVRVSAFRSRVFFLAPGALQWVVQIWSGLPLFEYRTEWGMIQFCARLQKWPSQNLWDFNIQIILPGGVWAALITELNWPLKKVWSVGKSISQKWFSL